jgi:signal peptidase I
MPAYTKAMFIWRFILKRSHFTREIVELVVITLLLFIVIRFVVRGYHMQSANMQPSISQNAYIMANRTSYLFSKPQRGDVVVLQDPVDSNEDDIVRIIGLPGDDVKTDSAHVIVNGLTLNEPYVSKEYNPEGKEWKIPADSYFVLNDNRQFANDSRNWGTVAASNIIGKAVLVFWPSNQIGFINTYSSVFDPVKNVAP